MFSVASKLTIEGLQMRTTNELTIYATAVLLVVGLLAATWWYAAQGEARQCY